MGRSRSRAVTPEPAAGRRANMAGSVYPIRERGKITAYMADVPWDRGPGAERIRRRIPLGAGTEDQAKQEAERVRADLVRARDGGLSPRAYTMTMGHLFGEYLAAMEGQRAAGTLRCIRSAAELYVLPQLEHRRVADLSAREINRLLVRLAEQGTSIPLAAYSALCVALRWAQSEDIVASTAWLEDVRRPAYKPDKRIELTDGQVAALRRAALDLPAPALWIIAVDRGPRSGEIRGLAWPDVDWEGASIRIARQAQHVNGQAALSGRLKTRNSYRTIPISQEHVELLRQQREVVSQMRSLAGSDWREMGCVFPSGSGRPLNVRRHWELWCRLKAAAGLPDVPFHTLRHTAGSRMLRSGISIADVAAILGDTPATLLEVYAHAQVEATRTNLDRMDDRARQFGG